MDYRLKRRIILSCAALVIGLLLGAILCLPFIVAFTEGSTVYWDGYVVASNFSNASHVVTFVNGSWIMGEVKPNILGKLLPTAWESDYWVGIGGYNSDINIVQIGTEARYVNNYREPFVNYSAWYELFNEPKVIIKNFTVSYNDVMYASVTCLSNCSKQRQVWQLSLRDLTRKENFSTTSQFNATRRYGEWVIELRPVDLYSNLYINRSPSYFGERYTAINRTNYATVNSTTGRIKSFKYKLVNMSGIEAVSNLTYDGTSFYIR